MPVNHMKTTKAGEDELFVVDGYWVLNEKTIFDK